ncbi:hypothetical protein [Stenotrophomonas nematodicola]|uniref:hypothetical protein n=1 Tax=Stenotrophomonas nematodicola TaxID=2656746 RepID=UPI0012916E4E|nr:hypothetical protein [Stenotrophomonas nematodicola]
MSALPAGTLMQMEGLAESISASVERTPMERGVAKQRLLNTQVLCKFNATLYFANSDAADSFIDWYLDDIRCIGWFEVRNPRNGKLLTVRFEEGKVGDLSPVDDSAYDSRRAVVMEYIR